MPNTFYVLISRLNPVRRLFADTVLYRLSVRLCAGFVLVFVMGASVQAENLDLRLEGGSVSFSKNDVRIPGDQGTKFDMQNLTGNGSDPYTRFYVSYDFNDKHMLRLAYAPLEVSGTGKLSKDALFQRELYSADRPTRGKYKFNTYRLTYRWTFYDRQRWRWGVGAAALVRDAEIMLEQGDKRQSKKDLGLVPLLHLYGEYRLSDQVSAMLDVEGSWSPMGRAFDASLAAHYDFEGGWYLRAGYRTLEGGADNDDVYSFAWLHYAQAAVGYRF